MTFLGFVLEKPIFRSKKRPDSDFNHRFFVLALTLPLAWCAGRLSSGPGGVGRQDGRAVRVALIWFGPVNSLGASLRDKIDYTLDLREIIAPFTILKITQALREMKNGENLEIYATDQDTRKYLFQVLDATGQYRRIDINDTGDSCRILLSKKH